MMIRITEHFNFYSQAYNLNYSRAENEKLSI